MRYLLILFICLQSFLLKADEIYNLIKIPNLEVFKLNSELGINFLHTKKDIIFGAKKNIQCNKINKNNLQKKFKIVSKNLNKYKADFLLKNNLKFLILCENLLVSGINTGGIPNHNKKTLIIDINFNPLYFERMIHHEIFHMIQNSNKDFFNENYWASLNNSNFIYSECSTCSDRLGLDINEKTNGFLTDYSKSIPSEDMAEIFSFLMINNKNAKNKIQNDNILISKIEYLTSSLKKIDKNFSFK